MSALLSGLMVEAFALMDFAFVTEALLRALERTIDPT